MESLGFIDSLDQVRFSFQPFAACARAVRGAPVTRVPRGEMGCSPHMHFGRRNADAYKTRCSRDGGEIQKVLFLQAGFF